MYIYLLLDLTYLSLNALCVPLSLCIGFFLKTQAASTEIFNKFKSLSDSKNLFY